MNPLQKGGFNNQEIIFSCRSLAPNFTHDEECYDLFFQSKGSFVFIITN